ncbi:MAG: HAD family phosphatase [Bacteroidia bacterium]|nr:HAD family phosphatase [Bacteroidia bacterium]MDW8236666.1 HAD family phosphatase [Bacteroidia bacterium]
MRIRNLLLDLGGVLYGVDYGRTLQALGLSQDAFHLLEDPILKRYEKGEISTDTFLAHWSTRFPHLSLPQLLQAWNAMLLGPLPEAEEVLSILQAHFRLALFSNTNLLHIEVVEPQIALWKPYFDAVFYSCFIGKRKPDPEAFTYVLERLGWPAEETLFVDDNPHNIRGAESVGMRGYHLHPPNQPTLLLKLVETLQV